MKIIIPKSLEIPLSNLLNELMIMFKWSWIKTESEDCMVILFHGQYSFDGEWEVVGEVAIRMCIHGGMLPYIDFIRHEKLAMNIGFDGRELRETFYFHVTEKYLDVHWALGRWYHFCENRVYHGSISGLRRCNEENKSFAYRIGSDLGFDLSIFDREDVYWNNEQVEWYLEGKEGVYYEDEMNVAVWENESRMN